MNKKKIIIDTDFGTDIDDALAISLSLCCNDLIEIIAITIVGRQSIYRSYILKEYLKLAKRDNIPVYIGLDNINLISINPVPTSFNWFGNEGMNFFDLPKETAVDALIRILSQNNDIEIVAIGMLTNIANAITKSPSIIKNIKQLTIMGGQLNHIIYNENIFPFGIDYNLCSDPFSAMIVFTSEIKNIKLITADVTLRTWLTQEDYNILKKISENSNYLKLLLKDIDNWTPIQKKIFNDNNIDNIAFLHDPLTIGCAIMDNESFCNFQEYNIEPLISLNSSINKLQFRTIIHNNEIPNLTKKIQCSTNVNSEKFRQFLIERFINYFCKI